MAGLTQKQQMKIRKIGNIYFVGDGETDTAHGASVTACAAMMAEIILNLTLGISAAKTSNYF